MTHFVLLAEFDIDTGSQLSKAYPSIPPTADEHSLSDLMLPDGAHLREEDWTVFLLHRHCRDRQKSSYSKTGETILYGINLVRTKHIHGVRRGARVKAMSIISRISAIHAFKPLLMLALERYFSNQSDQPLQDLHGAVGKVLEGWHAVPLSPSQRWLVRLEAAHWIQQDGLMLLPQLLSMGTGEGKSIIYDGHQLQLQIRIDWSTGQDIVANVPVRIPLDDFEGEVGEFSVRQLVSKFHQPVDDLMPNGVASNGEHQQPASGLMVILHSVLAERRVLFMGNSQTPASELVKYVLALSSLFAPLFPDGLINKRVFPYCSLGNMDRMLKTPGYIGGVLNPAFQMHTDWWDVLCDIRSGKVLLSPRLEVQSAYGYFGNRAKQSENERNDNSRELGLIQADNEFIQTAVEFIGEGKSAEMALRRLLRQYIRRFIQLAAWHQHQQWRESGSYEISKQLFGPRSAAKDAAALSENFSRRIEMWLDTDSCSAYRLYWLNKMTERQRKSPCAAIERSNSTDWWLDDEWDFERQIAKLQSINRLPDKELGDVLRTISASMQSAEDVDDFLATLTQENEGGLLVLTQFLFHKNHLMRQQCLKILDTVCQMSKVSISIDLLGDGNIIYTYKFGEMFMKRMNSFSALAMKRAQAENVVNALNEIATESKGSLESEMPSYLSHEELQGV